MRDHDSGRERQRARHRQEKWTKEDYKEKMRCNEPVKLWIEKGRQETKTELVTTA